MVSKPLAFNSMESLNKSISAPWQSHTSPPNLLFLSLRRSLHHFVTPALTINPGVACCQSSWKRAIRLLFKSNLWKNPAVSSVYYKALLPGLKIKVMIHCFVKRERVGFFWGGGGENNYLSALLFDLLPFTRRQKHSWQLWHLNHYKK